MGQESLYRRHRENQSPSIFFSQAAEQLADIGARPCIEDPERLAAGAAERGPAPATIPRGRTLLDQAAFLKGAKQPAEITGVYTELVAELGRCRFRALGELEEDTRLGQRVIGVQQPLFQQTDLARVESVEPQNRIDVGCFIFARSEENTCELISH